jgi:hypothetical protein
MRTARRLWDDARMTKQRGGAAAIDERLPGADLVAAGLEDLAAGRTTIAGELLRSASVRLSRLGIDVPRPRDGGPDGLWDLVEAEVGPGRVHGRYNALRRRLSSFLRAAELAMNEVLG